MILRISKSKLKHIKMLRNLQIRVTLRNPPLPLAMIQRKRWKL